MVDQPAPGSDLPPEGLRRFASTLRELGSRRDVDGTLQLAIDLATEVMREIEVADVMFVRGSQVTTPVASHPLAVELAEMQQEVSEGPCLSAAFREDEDVLVSQDLVEEERWPRFAERAVDLGIRSAVAYRLFAYRNGESRLGALNLYGREPGIDDRSIEFGHVFAAQCAAALDSVINEEGLQRALSSRDVIGQAKGILMERHRVPADEAYAMLRRSSNDLNLKVREVAERVTRYGELPRP